MAKIAVEQLDPSLPFGARVKGLTRDLTQDPETRDQLNRLFEDRGMIVFEGVEATPGMQVAVSTIFGPLKDHPVPSVDRADAEDKDMVGVIEITNHPGAGIVEIDGEQLVTWQPWHFDHAYNNELNRAGVLRSITIAGRGGRTAFADGIQIYNAMNPEILKKAEGVEVLYNLDLRYGEQRFGLPENFRVIKEHDSTLHEDAKKMPCAIHPVLWTRQTGERVFHMCPYGVRGIVGDRSDAAYALLDEIWREAMRVIKPYYHEWRIDDMVIWDNWRMLHEATGCPPDEPRVVHRTTIKGDYGLGRFEDWPRAEEMA